MKYVKIITTEYAEKLDKDFLQNPKLWYEVILPQEKADELRMKTNGKYSMIWHEHCEQCWETLNRSSKVCYKSEDGFTWLCKNCYKVASRK